MKFNIKTLGYEAASRLPLPFIQKKFFNDHINIVMYHGVLRKPLPVYDWGFIDEGIFRNQMRYLKRHFEVIRLSEINERLGSVGMGRPVAVITFDDGYQNNYDVAFPVLIEEQLPATIFLTTGFIGTDGTIWPCLLHHAISNTSKAFFAWNGAEYNIETPEDKALALMDIKGKLKKMPYSQMISEVRKIILNLDGNPDEGIGKGSPYSMLSIEAIRSMAGSGLIEFGAHTHTHPILSRMSSVEQEEEIERSINAVSEITGSMCRLFAYPNGGVGDYDSETVRMLQSCGITTAVTTIEGHNDSKTSLMELKRYGIGANTSLANFKLLVHNIIPHMKSLGWSRRKVTESGC